MTPRTFDDLQEDVRTALAEVADGNPVLIEDHGKARHVIISLHDLKLLTAHIEAVEDRINRKGSVKTLLEIAREGAIPYAQMRRELDLKRNKGSLHERTKPSILGNIFRGV